MEPLIVVICTPVDLISIISLMTLTCGESNYSFWLNLMIIRVIMSIFFSQ